MNGKRDDMSEQYGDLLFADGFDDAILGVVERCGFDPVVCYSADKIIDILMKDDMSHEEAVEYYEFNILGAYVGEKTPMYLERWYGS
jgi:hypothetical protein